MNPAEELKRLFAGPPRNVTGTIISVDGQALKVRTARGVIDARSTDAAVYRVGQSVLLRDGIVQGRVAAEADVPVYRV